MMGGGQSFPLREKAYIFLCAPLDPEKKPVVLSWNLDYFNPMLRPVGATNVNFSHAHLK